MIREHVLEPVNIRIENGTGKPVCWSVVKGDATEAGAYSSVSTGFHNRVAVDAGETYTVFIYAVLGDEMRIDGTYQYKVTRITEVKKIAVLTEDARTTIDVHLDGDSLYCTQTKTERIYE